MQVTEVRVFLREGQDKKLKAYATVTFDNSFVVRNIKVIEGQKGLFVAMPSRKMKEACPRCNFKNVVRSKYCNNCGSALDCIPRPQARTPEDEAKERQAEHKDIAHPITLEFREMVQKKVLEAYEVERKKGPSPARGGEYAEEED